MERMPWGEIFKSLYDKRELDKEANRTRSHEGHSTGFIRRKCRGGKVTQFWSVCHDCHEFLSTGTVKRSKVPNWQDLPLMSVAEVEEWKAGSVRNATFKKISDTHQDKWWRTYDNYLKSSEWKVKRILVMERDNGTCRRCRVKADHVHHLSYERVGAESLSDLVAVCAGCHKWIHSRNGRAWSPSLPEEHYKILWLLDFIAMGSTVSSRVHDGETQWSLGPEGDQVFFHNLNEAVDFQYKYSLKQASRRQNGDEQARA